MMRPAVWPGGDQRQRRAAAWGGQGDCLNHWGGRPERATFRQRPGPYAGAGGRGHGHGHQINHAGRVPLVSTGSDHHQGRRRRPVRIVASTLASIISASDHSSIQADFPELFRILKRGPKLEERANAFRSFHVPM